MSGQRHFARVRCASCALHEVLCYCDHRPAVKLPFDVWVVQHNREKNKPTNTVRSLADVISGLKILRYAVRGEVFDPTLLSDPHRHYALLFPDPEAIAIGDWKASVEAKLAAKLAVKVAASRGLPGEQEAKAEELTHGGPAESGERGASLAARLTLVVLDGTWAQCSRMRHRVPVLCDFLAVTLSQKPRSGWGIRHTPDPSRVSTFEAVALAIAEMGHDAPAQSMLDYFEEVSRRLQLMRGTLPVSQTKVPEQEYRQYLISVNTQRPERSDLGKKR